MGCRRDLRLLVGRSLGRMLDLLIVLKIAPKIYDLLPYCSLRIFVFGGEFEKHVTRFKPQLKHETTATKEALRQPQKFFERDCENFTAALVVARGPNP